MGKIIGESFDPYVAKQIEVRQKKLGATTRDSDLLAYTTSKTSWLRLTSGVDIDQTKLKELGRLNQGLEKNLLAKSYVLFGGANNVRRSPEPKGGFLDSYSNLLTQNAAYGFNSTQDYGAVPLPGIESAEIVPKNRGSLREANIVIKAFNREQFNIIETLYMRLKYSILLEWGHTMYFNNKGTLMTRPIDRVYEEFLKENPTDYSGTSLPEGVEGPIASPEDLGIDTTSHQNTILNLIKKQRIKSNGNYDGFLGWVNNFSWEISPHGVYTINVKAIGYGDIIESLSITKPLITNLQDTTPSEEEELTSPPPGSALEILLTRLKQVSRVISEDQLSSIKDFTLPSPLAKNQGVRFKKFSTNTQYVDGIDLTEDMIAQILTSSSPYSKPLNNPVASKELITFNTFIHKDGFFSDIKSNQEAYIKLGSLLRIINNFFLIYDSSQFTYPPTSNIDYEYNTTYCSIPKNLISSDHTVCLIPSNLEISGSYVNKTKGLGGLGGTFIQNRTFSANCNTINEITGKDFIKNTNNNFGLPLHIHINIDFIISQLQEVDENGDLSLYDFLTRILKGINSALGGVTDLGIHYDEVNNTYYIIDNNPPRSLPTNDVSIPTRINIKGIKNNIGSFATNFSINSEISNKLANQIAIGAQANDVNIGSNSVSFSFWNKGLTDRLIPYKSYSTDINQSKNNTISETDKKNTAFYINTLQFAIANFRSTESTIQNLGKYKSNVVSYLKTNRDIEVKNGTLLSKSFIPISLNLTLDGISGMKLFQKYTINDEILPQNYRNNIEFLTKGLRHSIDQSGWTTSIEGLSIPKQNKSNIY